MDKEQITLERHIGIIIDDYHNEEIDFKQAKGFILNCFQSEHEKRLGELWGKINNEYKNSWDLPTKIDIKQLFIEAGLKDV